MAESSQRYTAIAIVLHWAIALAIVSQILLGWWMHGAIEEPETQAKAISAFQLHKSVGLTILALSFVRLFWRLAHKPPALPAHMPGWERFAARASHWTFYALMIVMPLTGWLYVSTGWSHEADRPLEVPTLYFGLFQVPHLFGLAQLGDDLRAGLAELFVETHELLAWGFVGLLALHVGAALKHHFYDQDDVLAHMVPGLKPLAGAPPAPAPERFRKPILIVGLIAILLAAAGWTYAFLSPAGGAANAPAIEQHEVAGGQHAEEERAAAQQAAPVAVAPETAAPEQALQPPPEWRVYHGASAIRFAGTHGGVPFEGSFARWRADIRFGPDNLADSAALVTIEMGSAADGNPLHEETLPSAEWFDVANHPNATFQSGRMRARGDGRYEADGVLTLKGRAIDIDLPFTLSIQGDRAVMDGRATIRRDEADLGMQSDPDAEFVSREIEVRVHVEATRAP